MLLAICGAFALAAAVAVFAPAWYWVPLAIVAMAAVGVLAFRHIVAVCVAWLVIAGATLEMTLGDIVGPGAYQGTIAAVKTAEIGLALLCILRYGLYPDMFNPGLAFMAMFIAGLAHGLHPDLTPVGSLRSLLGSVAPFAFAFSRLSPGWGGTMVRATALIPLLSVAGGVVLQLAGLRPAFTDSFGVRLAGLGEPGILAGFCLAAIYACLIELYRDGRSRWLLLLATNFLILVLTGARSPLACAIAVTGLTLGFVRSGAFSAPAAHPDDAAGRLPAAVVGGPGPGAPDGAVVPCMERRGDQPQRPRSCCGRHSSRRPRRRHGSVGGSARATRSSRRTARWRG